MCRWAGSYRTSVPSTHPGDGGGGEEEEEEVAQRGWGRSGMGRSGVGRRGVYAQRPVPGGNRPRCARTQARRLVVQAGRLGQAVASARSSVRLRVLLGSTGMPGPIVVVKVTFFRYRPLAAAGLSLITSSRAAAWFSSSA